jgi:hypothetical protein
MDGFCAYKNVLGTPLTGVHSLRIGKGIIGESKEGIAVFDVLLAIGLALPLARVLKITFLAALLLSIFLGIILHRIFCVRTTVDKIIFK